MRVLLRATGILLSAALLASCASNIEHPVPSGPSFEDDEVRFVAPTAWEIQPSTSFSFGGNGQIRVYLANQPLRPDCDAELVCQAPLADGLRADGMFVVWLANSCVAKSCELPAATLISIGNRQGVRVPMTVGCEGTGFTERSAYYVTVTPQRVDVLFTCARDPSDATRSAFLGFLDAIHWRIP
ncbi:MAG: hypothetical protein ACXWWU_05195 [Candidatus Limnocylindria bacterium]